MGILTRFVADQLWSLSSTDNNVFVEGQYILPTVTHDKSVKLGSLSGLGRENPIIAFLSGDVEKISFETLMFSTHYWDNIEDRVAELFSLIKPLPDTGVTPRCVFFHGNFFMECLVKSIGGVTYPEPKYDGNLKSAKFNIELWRFEDTAFDLTSAGSEERETKYLVAREGDYYEMIAAREYGDPMLGVNMRKIHPFPNLQPADPIKVLRRTHSKIYKPIIPEEYLLQQITTDKDLSNDMFESRNRTKQSFIV